MQLSIVNFLRKTRFFTINVQYFDKIWSFNGSYPKKQRFK